MSLTADQAALVRQSYAMAEPVAGQAAGFFYGRLFHIAPETRALFSDTNMMSQSNKLWAMLGSVVSMIDQPEKFDAALVGMAKAHAGYGVTEEHYAPVGEALIWTLEQALGKSMSEEVREAWAAAYGVIAQRMIAATKETTE